MLDHFAVFLQVFRPAPAAAVALNGNELEIGEPVKDLAEPAVEENGASIDDNDPLAKLLDVGHIMARKHDGGFPRRVMVAEEFADGLLGDDVEADGGFVQKKDLRLVQQGGDQLHFHPLAQRQFANHHVEFVLDRQQFGHVRDRAFE